MSISNGYPNYNQEKRIPRYRNFLDNIENSNFKRERGNFYNSINNNISTSLSSYDKYNLYRIQNTRENNFVSSTNRARSRSRSPCFCGCHTNNESSYIQKCHCISACRCDDIRWCSGLSRYPSHTPSLRCPWP